MSSVQINQEFIGFRLDKFLCKKFDISFALAQKIVRQKKVKVNGERVDISYKLNDADLVEIFSELTNRPENQAKQKPKISDEKVRKFWSWKIFEDENTLAIDKPSGLAVQGGSGIEFSVDDILTHLNCERASNQKLQLVHRLDKDTSGMLLIAKNSKAAEFLTECFRHKTIEKTYLALVDGTVKKSDGVIDIPLRKKLLGKNEKVSPDFELGKPAVTKYKLLKVFSGYAEQNSYSFLELKPITGRTHQLRVHCKEIGHAILNDVKYGGKKVVRKDVCKRMCLHSYKIKIADYFGGVLELETKKPEFC